MHQLVRAAAAGASATALLALAGAPAEAAATAHDTRSVTLAANPADTHRLHLSGNYTFGSVLAPKF
ncbi:hypothetical protein [Streptomyces erythrochromogenes]|uniref:hypothetical protein n=1 Tax=Streptomyces erythrochromogenes TaxID=285574 RepID=UPI0033E36FF9